MSLPDVPAHLMRPPITREPETPSYTVPHGIRFWRWVMTVLCQYCGSFIRNIASSKEQHGQTSHGICDACWPKACEEFGLPPTTPKPE